jgi:ATP-dependent DNA helicase RecQ
LIQQKVDPDTGAPLEEEQRIARQQLRPVLNYAESTECRRAIQLRYLGEDFAVPCGACDNCCEPRAMRDWSTEARQFMSCIARLAQRGQRFGAAHVIDILRGARSERLLSRGHDTLSVYGIGKQRSVEEWRGVARALIHQGLVAESQDGYPVLSLNSQSGQVLREELAVRIAVPVKRNRTRASAGAGSAAGAGAGPAAGNGFAPANRDAGQAPQSGTLFDALRALRKRLADEHGLPPYVVFHDSTLREMAERRPLTLDQFAQLPGVGNAKLARYGEHFIAAIAGHISRSA